MCDKEGLGSGKMCSQDSETDGPIPCDSGVVCPGINVDIECYLLSKELVKKSVLHISWVKLSQFDAGCKKCV